MRGRLMSASGPVTSAPADQAGSANSENRHKDQGSTDSHRSRWSTIVQQLRQPIGPRLPKTQGRLIGMRQSAAPPDTSIL
jgi:hypothetical protein